MKAIALFGILIAVVALSGCETVKGLFGGNSQIEAVLAAQVAGEYTVEFKKDGMMLHSERWNCTRGDDGKLSGCHKIQ
jgi:hypothetical protein